MLTEWCWMESGLVDIRFNRQQGVITARVARRNGKLNAVNAMEKNRSSNEYPSLALSIRSVSFMIQVRPYRPDPGNSQAVARFLQQKGAASSLRRVIQEIVKVCREQGVLIEDPKETLYMESVFDTPVGMIPERHAWE